MVLEKSLNVMTVRMAHDVGIDKVVDYAKMFNIYDAPPALLSMSLGAEETTLIRMTAAFGMLVNGGKRIEPSVIDRIQDRFGRTIYRQDPRSCDGMQGGELAEPAGARAGRRAGRSAQSVDRLSGRLHA